MIANKERIASLACAFAYKIKPGQLVLLKGPVGVGKTFFISKVVETLTKQERATSPTYSILNIYITPRFNIVHIDAYRLNEISFLELDKHLDDVVFIEYPTTDLESYKHILISMEYIEGSEDEREIQIRGDADFKS